MKKITLSDIAKEFNVSVNTVSRAINDSSEISDSLKERIKTKALEMGYVKNNIACSLRYGASKVIGIVFDNMVNPYFMIMTDKIQKALKKMNYDIMIFTINESFNLDVFNNVMKRQVDGIITFIDPNLEVYSKASLLKVPVVLLGRISNNLIPSIISDDIAGGLLAYETLKNLGYKKIAYVGIKEDIECNIRRYEGFKGANERYDVSLNHITESDLNHITRKYDAVFAYNDFIALQILDYIDAKKINMGIIGFDNIETMVFNSKRLSSISPDPDEMVENVLGALLDLIKNYRTNGVVIISKCKLNDGRSIKCVI